MSDGENSNGVRLVEVDDVIWETCHGAPSDGQVLRNSGHGLTCGWEPHDLIDGGVNGIEELHAQTESTTLVPACGFAVLIAGFVFKPNAGIHRFRNSASAPARTWSQGMPGDSPLRARRARSSISAAQAASTSAGLSWATSSRLAKSSAATPARSSTGRPSASRRSSCARDVMGPFYTPRWQPNIALGRLMPLSSCARTGAIDFVDRS